jgi:hypothetical protein
MAAAEITDGININAAIDSVQNGRHHHDIELGVVPQQLPPTGDGGNLFSWMFYYSSC